jgi:hypothetical protein
LYLCNSLKFNINKFKIGTSMKKLFALAIVASMAFFSCGNAPEGEEQVESPAVEQAPEQEEQQPTAEMPEGDVQEEAAPVAE